MPGLDETLTLDHRDLSISCRVESTADIPTSSGSIKIISFDQAIWNVSGIYSPIWSAGSPQNLTIPVDGIYLFGASILWDVNSAGRRNLYLTNSTAGSNWNIDTMTNPSGSYQEMQSINTVILGNAGDVWRVRAYQNSGSGINLLDAEEYSIEAWMSLIHFN